VGTPVTPVGTATGKAAVATAAFRVGGGLHVSVVVKATFAIVPDGAMTIVDPDPIVRADEHRDRSAASALVTPSDLAPRRVRADVLLAGHARAIHAQPVPAMGVRLVVAQGQEVVLDKRLAVRGAPDPSGQTREPMPFAAMQLAWELAARTEDNPVGIAEGPGAWAHVVDPLVRDIAAGFGPISPRWPSRRGLSKLDDRALAAPIPSFPADFTWGYFNVAPGDQRVPFLRGDEWIAFEGMTADRARIQSRLPGVRAAARVYHAGRAGRTEAGGAPIALEGDLLAIDADRMRCTVTWRGSFAIASVDDLADAHVMAGVELAASPLAFPASPPRRAPSAPPPAASLGSTLAIDASEVRRLLAATPFEAAVGAPAARPASSPPRPASVPRPASAPPPQAAPVASPRRDALGSTVTLDAATSPFAAKATPFERRAASASDRPSAPPPAPARSATPSPGRQVALGATLELSLGALRAIEPAVPFAPSTPAPRSPTPGPRPAATPFERGGILPPPPATDGPVTVDLSRITAVAPELTVGQRAAMDHAIAPFPMRPSSPPPAPRVPDLAVASGSEPPLEATTLGGFFLAAMARAAAR
jgi:hypothetical protein